MIVILKTKRRTKRGKRTFKANWRRWALTIITVRAKIPQIVGIIGDTSTLDTDDLKTIDVVADVKRVSEPFKLANRKVPPG